MALLHASARAAPRAVTVVATFDHGTGPHATKAAELVASEAARLGFPVVVGRLATSTARSEAQLRAERFAFLRDVARRCGGAIATAHTRDDQVETILMRVLRNSGARGLAALYAESDIVRPLVDLSRAEVAEYAVDVGARWIDDPTNASMRFLRNRVRRDLLPAIASTQPALERQLLATASAAADWRAQVDRYVAACTKVSANTSAVSIAAAELAEYSRAELAILWPAIAARVGLAMDWRGTERAAAFTTDGGSRIGARIPLTGGWEISRLRDTFELRRTYEHREAQRINRNNRHRPLESGMRWLGWRFLVTRDVDHDQDLWVAQLPADVALTVRRWQAGDRMRNGTGGMRKVKRFLSDAHISGRRRAEWPVVLAGDEIVWIPGVRRSDAAAVRPGRPGVLYRCDLDDR
jgi:tRNA(Ile)-lysidine synthase